MKPLAFFLRLVPVLSLLCERHHFLHTLGLLLQNVVHFVNLNDCLDVAEPHRLQIVISQILLVFLQLLLNLYFSLQKSDDSRFKLPDYLGVPKGPCVLIEPEERRTVGESKVRDLVEEKLVICVVNERLLVHNVFRRRHSGAYILALAPVYKELEKLDCLVEGKRS